MLNLILGRAGTGKSYIITEKIKESLKNNRKCIVIIPEQFSFETERNILEKIEAKNYLDVNVLSFTRLANCIFTKYGGLAGGFLTPEHKGLLIAKAAYITKDVMQIYGDKVANKRFIEDMAMVIDEMKNSAVSVEWLQDITNQSGYDKIVQGKLHDITYVLAGYEALLAEKFNDPVDSLTKALSLAKQHGFFKDFDVFIDGFYGFSGVQMLVIEEILKQSDNVFVSLCCDDLKDNNNGFGVFSYVQKTGEGIINIAKKNGVKILMPEVLQTNFRFSNDELSALEMLFLSGEESENALDKEEYNNIFVHEFDDIYEEIDFICARISRLVREENLRYNQIAIITRNLLENADIFDSAFKKYNIPLFFDNRESITSKPIFVFVQGIFDVINAGYRTEDVLKIAKTGAFGLEETHIAMLENYCYIWQISGVRWKDEFELNPKGLKGDMNDDDKAQLEIINRVRGTIINPICEFAEKCKNERGLEICENLYNLTESVGLFENLKNSGFEEDFEIPFERIYEALVSVLDNLACVFGEEFMPVKRFSELFSLACSFVDIGEIPNTLDQVIIGQADRIRADKIKVCFVSQLCEGIFPSSKKDYGILTKKEREVLNENGFDIAGNSFDEASLESFYAYTSFTLASDKLFLTYPKSDREYSPLYPSRYIENIKWIFKGLKEIGQEDISKADYATNFQTAFDAFSKTGEFECVEKASLREFLKSDAKGEMFLEKIEKASSPSVFKIINKDVARQLFGNNIKLSASRIERFANCPFAYFMEYGIKAKSLQKAEISAVETGSLIHDVLNKFFTKHMANSVVHMEEKQIKREIKVLILDFVKENLGDITKLSDKQKNIINNIARALFKIIWQIGEEFSQSMFTPCEFELSIGQGGDIEPLVLQTATGDNVFVEGFVDRVDVFEKEGVKYVRVIDYKTGVKDFKLRDVFYGLNMQMLVYLFSIWENGKEKLGNQEIFPAGILYFPAKQSIVAAKREDNEYLIKRETKKNYKMNGLLLDDMNVLEAMDKEISGVYIPVSTDKNGELKRTESIASLSQLGALRRYVEKQITDIANSLQNGEIDAYPAQSEASSPCDYCGYKAVCLNENCEKAKAVEKIGKDDFYKLISDEATIRETSKSSKIGDNMLDEIIMADTVYGSGFGFNVAHNHKGSNLDNGIANANNNDFDELDNSNSGANNNDFDTLDSDNYGVNIDEFDALDNDNYGADNDLAELDNADYDVNNNDFDELDNSNSGANNDNFDELDNDKFNANDDDFDELDNTDYDVDNDDFDELDNTDYDVDNDDFDKLDNSNSNANNNDFDELDNANYDVNNNDFDELDNSNSGANNGNFDEFGGEF